MPQRSRRNRLGVCGHTAGEPACDNCRAPGSEPDVHREAEWLAASARRQIHATVAHGWTPEHAAEAWVDWINATARSEADRVVAEAAWNTTPRRSF